MQEGVLVIKNRAIQHYIDLLVVLTHKEMKVRYKSSYLGYAWSILQPLSFALVFFIAFKIVMRIQMDNYTLFLLAGLFPWQNLSSSLLSSPLVFVGNSNIIKKVNFPRNLLVTAAIFSDMIHFLLALPVLVFFMFISGQVPDLLAWLYGVPLLILVQFLIQYGIGIAIASLNLFFRDLEKLTTIAITMLFYCTPIIYPLSMVPEKYQPLIALNPVAPIMVSWRGLLLNGTLDLRMIGISLFYGVLFLILGTSLYRRLSWKFAEVL